MFLDQPGALQEPVEIESDTRGGVIDLLAERLRQTKGPIVVDYFTLDED